MRDFLYVSENLAGAQFLDFALFDTVDGAIRFGPSTNRTY